MSSFAKEIISKIEEIKENTNKGTLLSSEEFEVLFLASLLEEESNGNS
jgi:predicted DNA-binding protein (UPF0278 family)